MNMASKNKVKKLKNSFLIKSGLKHKGRGVKGLHFFTSSQRKQNNKYEKITENIFRD